MAEQTRLDNMAGKTVTDKTNENETNDNTDKTEITESNSLISEDFETALNKAGFGKFNYLFMLIAIPASGTLALVTGTMSFIIPVAGPDLGLTPMSKSLIQSAPYFGMVISAFLWGIMSDSFGRKWLVVGGFLLDFIITALCACIPQLWAILIFKFISGLICCGPYSIFITYMSEMFSEKQRNIPIWFPGIFSCIAQILHVCLLYLVIPSTPPVWLPMKSWQLFIFYSGIPSLLTGVACLFCDESPKFLLEKGKGEKALDVCKTSKTIYTINTGQPRETYPVKKIRNPVSYLMNPKKVSAIEKMQKAISVFKPPYVNRLLMIFGIQASFIIVLNLIRLWLPEMLTVMENADPEIRNQSNTLCHLLVLGHQAQQVATKIVSTDHVYYDMIVLYSCCLIGQIAFAIVIKHLEKKTIIMSVATIAFCCVITIPNIDSEYLFIPSSITVAVLDVAFFPVIGLNVDIFPTSMRATSVGMTMMTGQLGFLAGNFLMGNLMYSYCDCMFYILAVLCVCIFVISGLLTTTPFESQHRKEME